MRIVPLVFVLTAGCVPGPYSTSATTSASTTNGTDSAGTTSAGATGNPATTSPTSSTSATSTAGSSGDTTNCSFPDCPGDSSGGGWGIECDLWTQNCPEGQKCMPWANDGGVDWNATKCTDVMPNAGKPGYECTVEGVGVSGVDSCEKGAMCFHVSPDTGKGICFPMCMGTPDAPTCPKGTNCVLTEVLILCLPGCDPLAQDCVDTDSCIPYGDDDFACVLDASGDMGKQNDPCMSADACDPGLFCADPALATECDPQAAGCCLPFCDLSMPECTNMGAKCLAWYEPGMEPPGLKNVGICGLP